MNTSKNCILYLVRTSEEDVAMLQKSLVLVEKNLLAAMRVLPDIILFHEKSFDETYRQKVRSMGHDVIFQEIEFELPAYSPELLRDIPEFYPHPPQTRKIDRPGFSIGYRFMCDFFSGSLYDQPILQSYTYYLRLDTDSFILSPLRYDLFAWMKQSECEYAFIGPAVQQDDPFVILGLWDAVRNWLPNAPQKPYVSFDSIPDGRMFYTNFELGKVSTFSRGSAYYSFYEFIRDTGNIFIRRWGDAPIKFLGVHMFVEPAHIREVHGFRYQHGAIYDLPGYRKPFPWKQLTPRALLKRIKSLLQP